MKIWVLIVFLGFSVPLPGQDKEERSAINAIKAGDMEALRSYLEKHPDANLEFSNGKTGLYYAIRYNQGRIAGLLIEYGAEVNRLDQKLQTPLMLAASFNNVELCKILIDRGADPLQVNPKGKRASDYLSHDPGSPAYQYLFAMEEISRNRDSIPSMQDGPYIFWESEDRIVLTYFVHDQAKNLTRVMEKTIWGIRDDTVVMGIERDPRSYRIRRDFPPDAHELTTSGVIFAIGDIHGRYDALLNLLINNQIIGPDLQWNFGEGHLVLLGDVFDRGSQVMETLWFLYDLQFQAMNSGGNVHVLLGNHEVMSMTGDHRYLNSKYDYFTKYTRINYYQLLEKNTILGRWLRSQNVIARINDNLFMHAGISPQFVIHGYEFSEINSRVRDYLNSDYQIVKGSPTDMILGSFGPMWYRGYTTQNSSFPEMNQSFVDQYLASEGLKRMVLGHNEQAEINTLFEGRVISADVAIDASGQSAQGVLISGDDIFRCFSDGRRERIE